MPQSIPLAAGLERVQPSRIRELANVAFGMDGVLRLQFGESNLPTPEFIRSAATQAMQDGFTFYTENAGLPSLRQAIAAKIEELHRVQVDAADEVLITASGVQALNVAIKCVIDPGDEALVLSPNWPNGSAIVEMFGGKAVEIPMPAESGRFVIDFAALEAAVTPRTRLLVFTSPSNPLGWVATVAEQHALLDFSRRHGLWLLADEVYERIYYGDTVAPSILRLCTRQDAVIVVNSFSKSYRMTGWRLGWVVGRRDLVTKAAQLNEFIVSHAPSFVQKAGEAALAHGEDEIAAMVETFHARMDFCYQALASLKAVSVPKPDGAFYLFPRIEGVDDSFQFALNLLRESKVAVAPGNAFGNGGEGAIRICYASDFSVLEPAMERFCKFVEDRFG
ncbi:aminotransferase class I/II-fold pyridoxal phosphate-dependent enzyme [bacterium]|nr:aminotransferase class I/II-fold pyridoxal phosphate-dependent enzyme [bacterium]